MSLRAFHITVLLTLSSTSLIAPSCGEHDRQSIYCDETLMALQRMVASVEWEDANPRAAAPEIRILRHTGTGLRFAAIPEAVLCSEIRVRDPLGHKLKRVVVRPFLMSLTECTETAWVQGGGQLGEVSNMPVVAVSWRQVEAWCLANNMRLPSEVEWIHAASGGSGRSDSPAPSLTSQREVTVSKRRAVAQGRPSVYGLYDLQGNVSELCQDVWFLDGPRVEQDGGPAFSASLWLRVLRGASWADSGAFDLRMDREPCRIDQADGWVGFRPAVSLIRSVSEIKEKHIPWHSSTTGESAPWEDAIGIVSAWKQGLIDSMSLGELTRDLADGPATLVALSLHPDASLSSQATRLLQSTSSITAQCEDDIVRHLGQMRQATRLVSFQILERCGHGRPNTLRAMIEVLRHDTEFFRMAATQVIGAMGERGEGAIDELLVAMSEGNPTMQAAVASSLGRIGIRRKDVTVALESASHSQAAMVRQHAKMALEQLR